MVDLTVLSPEVHSAWRTRRCARKQASSVYVRPEHCRGPEDLLYVSQTATKSLGLQLQNFLYSTLLSALWPPWSVLLFSQEGKNQCQNNKFPATPVGSREAANSCVKEISGCHKHQKEGYIVDSGAFVPSHLSMSAQTGGGQTTTSKSAVKSNFSLSLVFWICGRRR
ncbi:hypothetical protein FA13DRAFT_1726827 [Coprinellus micaceus]|uniref:Uncharacterized protein n=1 Tax=Coprinellus micaceus TaxID=71717 RepID=A0A4Y7TSF7_COPMI|nr:hypothetical protein FA13DRAFT_1726827 [Coprinellus micaceus]